MARKQRVPDLHFYEWSVVRWYTSDTRARLDPAGRGIFRDLLDLCYTQGGIPSDAELRARKADCTDEQMRRTWPLIQKHFHQDKHDRNLLVNDAASAYRKQFFRYLNEQKRHGKAGSDAKRTRKSNGDKYMSRVPNSNPGSQEETTTTTRRDKTTTSAPGLLSDREWPLSSEYVCREFTTTDSPLMLRIIQASVGVAVEEGLTLTDGLLAQALEEARSKTPRQESAALYETTAPAVIRNWAREARRRRN